MDILTLATTQNENNGVWFQFEAYGRKQDLDLLIYGNDSDVVKKYERDQLRDLNKKRGKNGALTEEALDEMMEQPEELAIVKIGDFRCHSKHDEPIKKGDVVLTHDKAGIAELIKEIPEIIDFVKDISKERENFLSKKEKSLKKQ